MKGRQVRRWAVVLLLAAAAVVAAAVILLLNRRDTSLFQEKAALLRESVLADWVELEVGLHPAGRAGQVVFLSVCDTTRRADVYTGTGTTLAEAWDAAAAQADKALQKSGLAPTWLKADVVYLSETVSMDTLAEELTGTRQGFFRYGAAFDQEFRTALLEAELNGTGLYDYENGTVDQDALNAYLKQTGRRTLPAPPDGCILFQCIGWLCDEDNQVHALSASGPNYGRRQMELHGDYAKSLAHSAAGFLADQVREDGSFLYGMDPRFDRELDDYNMVRHAGAVWSLLCAYRLAPEESLAEKIDKSIVYLLDAVVYDAQGCAYLYEAKQDEIKLGGCALAVAALTEYMDVFQSKTHQEVCTALGKGILALMDQDSGTFYHVLNGNFTRKEEFRTIYYDGEAAFALCRLYGLTEDPLWLAAAESAVGHFIAADYAQYKDCWVAYTMNEMTKYLPDRPEYYTFALENARNCLEDITRQDTAYHTYLELLLNTFELYDRMVQNGGAAEGFDLRPFLSAIYTRADRQLNEYFYPEYAMYMQNPQRIVDTFMVRQDGFRVRIDDVQHNISGCYLYCVNYEKLVQYGMLVCAGLI